MQRGLEGRGSPLLTAPQLDRITGLTASRLLVGLGNCVFLSPTQIPAERQGDDEGGSVFVGWDTPRGCGKSCLDSLLSAAVHAANYNAWANEEECSPSLRRRGKGSPGSNGLTWFHLGDLKTVLLKYLVPSHLFFIFAWVTGWKFFFSVPGFYRHFLKYWIRMNLLPYIFSDGTSQEWALQQVTGLSGSCSNVRRLWWWCCLLGYNGGLGELNSETFVNIRPSQIKDHAKLVF